MAHMRTSAPIPLSRTEQAKVERLRSNTKRPTRPQVEDREMGEQPVWTATRRGERIVLCAHHLLADANLSDAAPATEEGRCDRCSEVVVATEHSIRRWLERVGGRDHTEAAGLIMEFASRAFTPMTRPRWLTAPPVAAEMLMNLRWDGVVLLKCRGTRGHKDSSIIVTCLTSAGPDA